MFRWVRRHWLILATSLLVGVSALAWYLNRDDAPSGPAFSGPSTGLRQTVFVPTLDTPIPPGKSAIWCASFQLAWDSLKQDVVKEPVRIAGAEEVAERLNKSAFPAGAIHEENYYAQAGLVRDGVVERIRNDMSQRFPQVRLAAFEDPGTVAQAFAYLQGTLDCPIPYSNHPSGLTFSDSQGQKHSVAAFGCSSGGARGHHEQVEILHLHPRLDSKPVEFALDLCMTSKRDQVVVARFEPKATLAESMAYLEKKLSSGDLHIYFRRVQPTDLLWVPKLNFNVEHRFEELEGPDKPFANQGWGGTYLGRAFQMIEFRLDAKWAGVASRADTGAKSGEPKQLVLDRPFLVYLKKRQAELPYFVMWVDNAELLLRHGTLDAGGPGK